MTPEYAKRRGFPVYPMADLSDAPVNLIGLGGVASRPFGWCLVDTKIPGISGFDEPTVFLVFPDISELADRCPILVGTASIRRVINVMRESELDRLSAAWITARGALALSHCRDVHVSRLRSQGDGREDLRTDVATKPIAPTDLDEWVRVPSDVVLPPYSTSVVHGTLDFCLTGHRLTAMVAGLTPGDEKPDRWKGREAKKTAPLPPGLQVWNTYVTLENGSSRVPVVLRNTTGESVHLARNQWVAKVSSADVTPKALIRPDTALRKEDKGNPPQPWPITKRQEVLIELLELSGLDTWTPEMRLRAISLLQEYHDIFSLEPNELGCTSTVEHKITLTDHTPFKERFRRLTPPQIEEVRKHLSDMLTGGAIRPSQSPGVMRSCSSVRKMARSGSALTSGVLMP